MRKLGWLCLLGLLAAPASAQVYKWVDEQGRVHYSDQPQGSEGRTVPIRRTAPAESTTEQDRRAVQERLLQDFERDRVEREEARAREAQEQAQRERNCILARDYLRNLESAGLLYDLDDQGNRRVLNEAERKRAEQDARRDVEHWCGG